MSEDPISETGQEKASVVGEQSRLFIATLDCSQPAIKQNASETARAGGPIDTRRVCFHAI